MTQEAPFAEWPRELRDELRTRRLSFKRSESMVHDLANTGEEDLIFTTIEYLASTNPPLPLDELRSA